MDFANRCDRHDAILGPRERVRGIYLPVARSAKQTPADASVAARGPAVFCAVTSPPGSSPHPRPRRFRSSLVALGAKVRGRARAHVTWPWLRERTTTVAGAAVGALAARLAVTRIPDRRPPGAS